MKNERVTPLMQDREDWVRAPEFKKKLDAAQKWMLQYLEHYPNQEGAPGLAMNNVFQSELHGLDDVRQGEIIATLKRLLSMDWGTILQDCTLECKALAGEPGSYALRLSESHRAIVCINGSRLVYLALHKDEKA